MVISIIANLGQKRLLAARDEDERTRQIVEAAIVTLAASAYALAFPTMYQAVGPSVGALAVLPVILTAWFWGCRVGVGASIMAGLALNPILFIRYEDALTMESVLLHAMPHLAAVFLIAFVTGRLRDLHVRFSVMQVENNQQRFESERETREKIEELLKLKSAFLNNMSHEVRTPLTGILGFAEILREEIAGEQREFAERILSSGQRLQNTLDSILDLSQLEGGGVELQTEEFDVVTEVASAVMRYEAKALQKGLQLTIAEPGAEVKALLDRSSLQRIVKALVDNAIKFTDEGLVLVEISSDHDSVYISIKDSGIGISEEFLPHMFSEFRQESVGHGRSYEGSGLGLAITKRLVELMGGTIHVESVQSIGSTFTVAFPLSGSEMLRWADAADLAQHSYGLQLDSQTRLLVVDDNVDTLTLTRHQLRGKYSIATACDVESAIETARNHQFDALLLDINLGSGPDGVELLQVLRTFDAYKDVPVVALTAYAMPGDRERFLDAGFDAYLGKPFTRQEIMKTVEHVLDAQKPVC